LTSTGKLLFDPKNSPQVCGTVSLAVAVPCAVLHEVVHCRTMSKTKIINVRVEPRHESMLASYPSDRDLTVSELVRRVIEEWHEQRQRGCRASQRAAAAEVSQ
jgi:hypothetical protein